MLYQKGTQRIAVYVYKRSGGRGGSKGAKDADETQKDGTSGEDGGGAGMSRRTKRIIKVNATHILAASKQVAQQTFTYVVGGIGFKYGDQSHQQRVERTTEIVQDTTNIASGIGMGVTYGSAGGPITMLIGGFLGAMTTIFPTAFKYTSREREYNIQVYKEENGIEYQRARAGINLSTGRLR